MEDLNEILVSKDVKDVTIEFKSKEYKFKLRDLSWSDKNRMLSKCVALQGKNVVVDVDAYYRTALQEMIVEAPWPLNQTVTYLRQLGDRFGQTLQQFVPSPFTEEELGEGELPKN